MPSDRIFALLGLVNEEEATALNIQVDYSLPTSFVFAHAARRIVSFEQSLRILSVTTCLRSLKEEDLPSWTPNWSALHSGSEPAFSRGASLVDSRYFHDMLKPFQATRGSAYAPLPATSPHILVVEGFVADRIFRVHFVLPVYSFPSRWRGLTKTLSSFATGFRVMPEEAAVVNGRELCYVNGEDMRDAFWRTLCCNRIGAWEIVADVRLEYLELSTRYQSIASVAETPIFGLLCFIMIALWSIIEMAVLRRPLPTFQTRWWRRRTEGWCRLNEATLVLPVKTRRHKMQWLFSRAQACP